VIPQYCADAADPQIIIANVIIGQRPDIELVETGAPEILLKIMQQSWNKDPIQRPEFAGTVSMCWCCQCVSDCNET